MKNIRLWLPLIFFALVVLAGMAAGCGAQVPVTTTPPPTISPPPPPTPSFEITSLVVTPPSVVAGQPVMVGATVANTGTGPGTYTAVLKVGGQTVETQEIALGAGESKAVSFQYLAQAAGRYELDVNGLAGSLNALRPAAFEVSSVTLDAAEVVAGQPVTITAEIRNSGDIEGTYTATLVVDGKVASTRDISVGANSARTLSIPHVLEVAGVHTVDVGGRTNTVKALKPAQLEARSARVTPAWVFPGQEATVEADITNAGEARGTLRVALTVDGAEVDWHMVTLEPGASERTSFKLLRDQEGKHDVSVSGATASLTVSASETYESRRFFYSVDYPSGWEIDEANPQIVKIAKAGAGVQAIIAVDTVSPAVSPDEFRRLMNEALKQGAAESQIVAEREITKDGVVTGYRQEVSAGQARMSRLLLKTGRYGFSVIGISPAQTWDLNKPFFDAIIESFTPPAVIGGTYSNSLHGFSLTTPTGWDGVETGTQAPVVQIMSPVGRDPVFVFVYLERLAQAVTAGDYALRFADAFDDQEAYRLVSEGDVALGGAGAATAGHEVVFAYTAGATQFKQKVVSVMRGTQAFTIQVFTAEATYERERSVFDQLVRSFTLVEPKPFGVSRQDSLFRWQGEIVTLDPGLTEDSPAGLIGTLFSGLVRIDEDLKAAPDIAESWRVSADGKTYTFLLRDGVKFHDGKPVTAADFKFSWERALDPGFQSAKARTYLGDIAGAAEKLDGKAAQVRGIRVINERTLEVTIDGAKPYFLDKLAQPVAFVVDRTNVARGKFWTDAPNGTGPFKLKEWKKGELLVLERNGSFYGGPVGLKNIVFQIFAGSPMMMYERGEIDMTGVGLNDIDRVADPENPLNKELLTGKGFEIGYLGFNVTMPPFDDPKVRRAFALAIDVDKILEVSLKGIAERAGGFVPPGIPGHNPDLRPLPYDPVQARQLIAESRYGSADRLPPVTMSVLFGAGPDDEAMVAMWRQNLGVEVNVEAVEELEEWYERRHRADFQLIVGGWGADYVDPQDFLEVLFHSQSEENGFAYVNPGVDAALEKAAIEPDGAERLKKYQEIEKTILNDLPAAPLYQNPKGYVLVKPYVKGLKLYSIDVNHWKDLTITPH